MTKFTERVEQDLSQIADRATPSSTAWESIQQRIAEQTTQPTMEVIMLNPDQKKPPTVSRTWMAVAAALILVVGIGGLVALLNQDDGGDIDTIDTPDSTIPLELDSELEPEVIVPDDEADLGAGPVVVEEPLVMTGEVIADCTFDGEDIVEDLNIKAPQSCVFRDTSVVPFAATQEYVMTIYQDPEFHDPANPFAPITGLSDSGFMYAGYMFDGVGGSNARFVGAAEGVGPYEGMIIRVSARFIAADGGALHMQWVAGDDLSPLMISGTDVVPEEFRVRCEIVGAVEDADGDPTTEQFESSCDFFGTVSPLLHDPSTANVFFTGIAPNTLGVGDNRYFLTPGKEVVAGIIDANGFLLAAGIEAGTGQLDGMLIHTLELGVEAEGEPDSVARRVALPPTE